MKKNSKLLKLIAVMMVAMLLVFGCATDKKATSEKAETPKQETTTTTTTEKKDVPSLTLLTGSSGGLYYVVGAGIGDVVNKNSTDVKINAEPSTGGSTERVRLVGEGDVQLGMTTSIVAWQGYMGEGDFSSKAYKNLRIALCGHQGYMQIAVARDSDIYTMEDLKGKTIATGQGAGVLSLEQALAPYGLVKDRDFKAMPLNEGEFVNALKNKQVDAIAQPNGLHTAYFEELNATVGLRWLSFDLEATKKIAEEGPYNLAGVTIPAGTYDGQDEEIITFSVPCVMVTSEDVPEEVIYNFVKAVFENNEELKAIHNSAAEWNAEHGMYLYDSFVPLHPGTVKYLTEKGILGGSNAKAETKAETETKQEAAATAGYFAGKTIKVICPWGAGGSVDLSGRILCKYAEKTLGCTIVVENIKGGSGSVGYTECLNRPKDGTNLVIGASPLMTHEYLIDGVTYTIDSFDPVIMTTKEPNMIVVKSDSKWADMTPVEFLRYAKEHPKEIVMGVGGHWASHDIARAALEIQSGIQFKKVAFDGGSEVVANVLGGHVDCGFNYYAEFASQVESGELKVLCCTGDTRHPYMPDVPTINELAKEFGESWDLTTIGSWKGILAPNGLPEEALKELREGFLKATEDPEFIKAMDEAGLPLIIKDSAAFAELIQADAVVSKAIADQLIREGKN